MEGGEPMELHEKLKEKRLEAKLTQKELAELLHVSRQTVSSWEVGRTYPDLTILVELSELYKVSLDDLLKEDSDFVQDITNKVKNSQLNKKIIVFLTIVLISVLTYGGYGAYQMYIHEQANEEGLRPNDLLNSTWQMNYDPSKELHQSYLSIGSTEILVLSDYGERYQFITPETSPAEIEELRKEREEKGLKSGLSEHNQLNIKTEGDTYIVEGYGYRQEFKRLSSTIIQDKNGVEYYYLHNGSDHEAMRRISENIQDDF